MANMGAMYMKLSKAQKARYPKDKGLDIRIGTLVNRGMDSAEYIKQIVPYGFESFSLTFWQSTKGVKWKQLADEVNAVLEGTGAVISTIGVFGNPMEKGEIDKESLRSFRAAIDNAHLFGCDIVNGFTGRMRGTPIHENIKPFKKTWTPLAKRAADKGIRIAFENCDISRSSAILSMEAARVTISREAVFVTTGNIRSLKFPLANCSALFFICSRGRLTFLEINNVTNPASKRTTNEPKTIRVLMFESVLSSDETKAFASASGILYMIDIDENNDTGTYLDIIVGPLNSGGNEIKLSNDETKA